MNSTETYHSTMKKILLVLAIVSLAISVRADPKTAKQDDDLENFLADDDAEWEDNPDDDGENPLEETTPPKENEEKSTKPKPSQQSEETKSPNPKQSLPTEETNPKKSASETSQQKPQSEKGTAKKTKPAPKTPQKKVKATPVKKTETPKKSKKEEEDLDDVDTLLGQESDEEDEEVQTTKTKKPVSKKSSKKSDDLEDIDDILSTEEDSNPFSNFSILNLFGGSRRGGSPFVDPRRALLAPPRLARNVGQQTAGTALRGLGRGFGFLEDLSDLVSDTLHDIHHVGKTLTKPLEIIPVVGDIKRELDNDITTGIELARATKGELFNTASRTFDRSGSFLTNEVAKRRAQDNFITNGQAAKAQGNGKTRRTKSNRSQ